MYRQRRSLRNETKNAPLDAVDESYKWLRLKPYLRTIDGRTTKTKIRGDVKTFMKRGATLLDDLRADDDAISQ